eukprot:TRINITY_DN4571_c0_g1_i4.p1 TRINITY_DN4571_c0_g1~~TRINITY_DN4571_c0_g1_i4.p1  ORF type:complete len:555 (-),score=130.70 TRINITY_DN4571_c0_g1_i4:632-2296(-)
MEPNQETKTVLTEDDTEGLKKKEFVWEDITSLISQTSDEMVTGQIIKLESYSLYEAMSALELMDPKMDMAMVTNIENVHTLDEAYDMKLIDKSSTLSPSDIIGVMDKLIQCEIMWYTGNTLSQTLMTCLYLHNPEVMLDDLYLKPFIYALFRRAAEIRNMIMAADTYEEEDFLCHLYGFQLKEQDENLLLQSLKTAEEDLQERQKPNSTLKPLQDDSTKEAKYVEALLTRIRFAKHFYTTTKSISKPKSLPAAKKSIAHTLNEIQLIKSTQDVGSIPNHLFQPEICRRILQLTHPKKTVWLTLDENLKQLEEILKQSDVVCSITEYNSLEKLEQFILHLVDQQAGIVVRSQFMNLFWNQQKVFGTDDLLQWVIQNGKETFEIPERYFKNEHSKDFLSTLCKVTKEYFRILSSNKARRRRNLAESMSNFSILIEEGDLVDTLIGKSYEQTKEEMGHYFFCWMTDKALRCMIQWIKLGFELELYDTHEYPSVYWYLDCLLHQRKNNHHYVLQYNKNVLSAVDKRGGGKKKNKGKKPKPVEVKKRRNLELEFIKSWN